jgi:hypothetical protein
VVSRGSRRHGDQCRMEVATTYSDVQGSLGREEDEQGGSGDGQVHGIRKWIP